MCFLAGKATENINDNFPFSSLNNVELTNLQCSNTMSFLKSLPNLELLTEVSKSSNSHLAEVDLNMAFQTECKYYSVNEYQKLKNKRHFNLFHTNINSLESKFEDLHEFISSISSKFGILAITESSQKDNENFKLNIKIDGYEFYSAPSNTNKGGTV